MAGKSTTRKPAIRQSRLDDPKVQKKYLAALARSLGHFAAAEIGFTHNGAMRYRRAHPDFNAKCLEAEAKCHGLVESIAFSRAIDKGEEWAVKLILQCKFRWSHYKPEHYSIKDLVRFASQLGQAMAAALPADHQVAARRIIDQQMELFLLGGTGGR